MLKIKRREMLIAVGLALLFSIMEVIGYHISMKYGTSVHISPIFVSVVELDWLPCVGIGIILWCIWTVIIYGLYRLLEKMRRGDDEPSRKQYWWKLGSIGFVLFIIWIPALMANYPGYYNEDVGVQLPQVLYDTVPYSTHHPLLHTVLMGKIIQVGYIISGGELGVGVLLYSLFQMVCCAISFSYFLHFLWVLTRNKILLVCAFCYYAAFPTIVMFTMSTTKDVLCAVMLQFSVCFFYDIYQVESKDRYSPLKMICLVLVTTCACLLRNNVIYVLIVFFVFVFFYQKRYRKRQALALVCSITLYLVCNQYLIWTLNAQKGSLAEAFSVPLQQIARLYNKDKDAFDQEELVVIGKAVDIEILDNYNPFLSDNIKNQTKFDVVLKHKKEYINLWLRKGIQYPDIYIASFLENTYQAWYPWTSIVDDPGTGHIFYFDYKGWDAVEMQPKITWLHEFYRKIAEDFFYQRIPVLRFLFSIGGMFWILLFCCSYGILRRDKAVVSVLVYVLLYYCTALLGPISVVRYYLILFYGFPINIAFCMKRNIMHID